MKPELKKLLILNAPYLLFVYLFDKIGQAVRLAPGADLSGKVLSLADGFSAAFATPLPSLAPMDLLIGIVGAVLIRLMVYFKGKDNALAADTVKLIYEHGTREIPAGQHFNGNPDTSLGKFEHFEAVPNDPDALQFLLREEKQKRDKLTPGDFKEHTAALRAGLIEAEARRIVQEMKRRDTPNSPNRTHFMVELSPTFMQLASSKDTDRLFSMLPYKTLSFSKIEGRHGTYALIDKNENRGTDIRRVRPSIRAQLAADKRKAAPKKAAVKSKNHELEV